ncbi:ADP-ribose pyrophosphatase [Halomicrobium zhouii]|uniref:ADP-ribose pyrophosphatase n=1 Tax=Halomicrobium zhouii TaxID=767519 RepID=A0A1I6M996_9EURY|nr:NUDIX hydrolase [Halomicrobium zhouii]SFS12310.1 ADP-ribose pyrophosphatase [Halomicrobium zhouii]
MSGHEWSVLDETLKYESGRVTVGEDRVEQPDGTERRCPWLDLPPAVVVVAVVDDAVLFVEQHRPAVRETHRELPAGFVEPETDGERRSDGVTRRVTPGTFENAAARELREETGFVADETTLLQQFVLETSYVRHERGVVVAEGLTAGERDLDDDEFLSVERVPVDETIDVARSQPANDITLEGLLLAKEDGYL